MFVAAASLAVSMHDVSKSEGKLLVAPTSCATNADNVWCTVSTGMPNAVATGCANIPHGGTLCKVCPQLTFVHHRVTDLGQGILAYL